MVTPCATRLTPRGTGRNLREQADAAPWLTTRRGRCNVTATPAMHDPRSAGGGACTWSYPSSRSAMAALLRAEDFSLQADREPPARSGGLGWRAQP